MAKPSLAATAASRALPDGLNPVLAAKAVQKLLGEPDEIHSTWTFARLSDGLPLPVIREVLERLPQMPHAVFIRELFDGTQASWAEALEAALRLKKLAQNPRVLAARGVRELPFLAVLAIDGSEASVDALLPHFVHAVSTQDEALEDLAMQKTHASSTKPMQAMFKQLAAAHASRRRASPALILLRRFGFDEQGSVEVNLRSAGDVTFVQATITIDTEVGSPCS